MLNVLFTKQCNNYYNKFVISTMFFIVLEVLTIKLKNTSILIYKTGKNLGKTSVIFEA